MRTPPERLETARLVLRCWCEADAPAVRAALDSSDAHLRPWIPFMKDEPRSLEGTARWLCLHIAQFRAGEHYRYGIFEPGGALVGEVMLLKRAGPDVLEVGYWILRERCGRGYASEAAQAMVGLGLGLDGVRRVEIHCDAENTASDAIPRRLGFALEAVEPLNIWALTGPE